VVLPGSGENADLGPELDVALPAFHAAFRVLIKNTPPHYSHSIVIIIMIIIPS